MAAERELSLDALFDADEAELVEASGLEREDSAVADVGERRPAPQRECGADAVRGEPGGAARQCLATVAKKPLEPACVDPFVGDLEDVPRGPRDERVLAERRTQPRDIYAQRSLGAWAVGNPAKARR